MPTSRTAVIILNWNRPDLTLACLDSLLPAIDGLPVTVMVCDNASDDDSVARFKAWGRRYYNVFAVEPQQARLLVLQTPGNLGYAGGNNSAILWALRLGFKYVWLLNNDTRVFHDTLAQLLEAARYHPTVGCFGATLLEADKPDIVQCAGGCRFNPLLTTYRPIYQGCSYSEVLEKQEPRLDYIGGASMFLRAEVFRRVGLLNETFFLYYEELDFARRLQGKNYGIAWCRTARVIHEGSASTTVSSISHYHENLSTLKYLWQHHRALFPFAASIRGVGKCMVLPLTGRTALLPSLMTAYRDFRPCDFQALSSKAELVFAAA